MIPQPELTGIVRVGELHIVAVSLLNERQRAASFCIGGFSIETPVEKAELTSWEVSPCVQIETSTDGLLASVQAPATEGRVVESDCTWRRQAFTPIGLTSLEVKSLDRKVGREGGHDGECGSGEHAVRV